MEYIKKNYGYFLFAFFIISILFWFVEIGYSEVIRNKFVLPGVWHGPYCPIYGLAFLLLSLSFRKEDNVIINIIRIAITVVLVEYTISLTSELFFHHIVWNYSNRFMNINGRVCLKMSMLFTIAGVFTMYILNPAIEKIYNKLGNSTKYINIVLSIIMIIDMLVTMIWR